MLHVQWVAARAVALCVRCCLRAAVGRPTIALFNATTCSLGMPPLGQPMMCEVARFACDWPPRLARERRKSSTQNHDDSAISERVSRVTLTAGRLLPVFPNERSGCLKGCTSGPINNVNKTVFQPTIQKRARRILAFRVLGKVNMHYLQRAVFMPFLKNWMLPT
jgi:hypothetical protein